MRRQSDTPAGAPAPGEALRLGPAAAELYDDLRPDEVLRRLLVQSGRLLGAVAGSVSLVDPTRSRYSKRAERGASCRLGETFSLEHGITGQVVAKRRPVVLPRYSDVPVGHVPEAHPAHGGAVAAVPIWWRGEVIGSNVAFAGRQRDFTVQEVDQLEVLSQVAAAGIVTAETAEPTLAHLIDQRLQEDRDRDAVPLVVTEVGHARPPSPEIARTARELVRLAQREAGSRSPAGPVRVAVIHHRGGLRLLVHDEGASGVGAAQLPSTSLGAWHELVAPTGGGVDVAQVPGWGVLVRVELPYGDAPVEPAPLTPRECEVLALLARGLTDRQVADTLVLARKTVEKHVGAVLRKTGTTSRTAAVVLALERGWVPAPGRREHG